ncbi:MAG TPA: hypothetical protein VHA10_07055 [Hypericibacter adhaerens]|nr:hypothetical protein [Hypericibacter adhaerens]HWA42951.1 hypothetical protein [Hypericibacter adhaerens]
MKLSMFFARPRRARKPARPVERDWTAGLSPRDWADLPTHHPRQSD